MNAEETIVT